MTAPSGAGTIRERLEQLAIEYHKSPDGEGEYGCNGPTCPGVQRLIRFAERVVAATTPPAPPRPR